MENIDAKVGVGEMKTKNICHFFKCLLNFRAQNSPKLVYPTLLSSDCRAWALKFSKYWKNNQISHKNRAKKDIN